MYRTTELVLSLEHELSNSYDASKEEEEKERKPWLCVLVAHGDVLQIVQTGFKKMDGTTHRSLDHLETATLRHLSLENRTIH
mmetsp:Transcript_11267/g.16793  ORF Transcript_11267/g.16793 Transcript_11267/m.16793 type:complete len:82 (+) Transcript_11267:477-722(+)